MLRPRESRELQLTASDLVIEPNAEISWAHDVFGNAAATATFPGSTDSLLVQSAVETELRAAAWPVFAIAADAISYPFR